MNHVRFQKSFTLKTFFTKVTTEVKVVGRAVSVLLVRFVTF